MLSLGPPDKKQHFDNGKVHKTKAQSKKGQPKEGKNVDVDNGGRHEVEIRCCDGVWYKGWLSNFNCSTGKWTVKFYDDDETTEVCFPDKDVRLVNK